MRQYAHCVNLLVGNKKAAKWRQSGCSDSFTPYLILKCVSVQSQVHYNDVRFLYTLRAKRKAADTPKNASGLLYLVVLA